MSDREGEITKGTGQEGIKGKLRGRRHDITKEGEREKHLNECVIRVDTSK